MKYEDVMKTVFPFWDIGTLIDLKDAESIVSIVNAIACLCDTINDLKEQVKLTREVLDEIVANGNQKTNFELWKEDN